MKFKFPEKDPVAIKDKIMEALGGRELGKMVEFTVSPNQMIVTISKFGTSKLTFDQSKTDTGLDFLLSSEKIAMTHKAFKDEVKASLCKVIEKVGGTVIEA